MSDLDHVPTDAIPEAKENIGKGKRMAAELEARKTREHNEMEHQDPVECFKRCFDYPETDRERDIRLARAGVIPGTGCGSFEDEDNG